MQGIEIPIGAPLGQLDKDLRNANSKLKNFSSQGEKSVNTFATSANSAFNSVAVSLAGLVSVGAFVSFGKQVLDVTAEFEKFGAVLGNTLGSNALAKLKLKEIADFAAKTPFGVKELTEAFVKLANQGFKPTGDEMRRLGDLAASTGKSFDQLAEGILDAQTGEFERLKEFGIRAQDAGDKVIFTFKGVQATVDKSSEAIRNYVTSLGDAEGVSGSMAVISETLTGKISNLGDSWDQMLVSVGSNTSGVFSSVIDIISKGINKITQFNKELEVQSKYKIGGSFLKRLTTSTEFDGVEIATNEKAIKTIIDLDTETSKFISTVISGAKNVSDFGDAIVKLKAEGDKKVKDSAILGKEAQFGIKDTYENAIKALRDGRTAFAVEAAKPAGAVFGTGKKEKKTGEDPKKKAAELQKEAGIFNQKLISSLIAFNAQAAVEASKQKSLLNIIDPDELDLAVREAEQSAKAILDKFAPLAPILQSPFQKLGEYINTDLLPQFSTSFKTFFDDLLMNGKLSFDALGQALKNTFISVLSSEATKGVLSLLSGGGNAEKGKGGGLLGGVLGLLKIGGGKAAAGVAAGTAGAGGAAAAAGGVAATGGALLPILAGVAAVAGIASLFKKKKQAPVPQTSSAISTSAAGSSQDFGGGRVVFEISGTNLIGVLNRAGAKLTRFG
jgi:hypothetical protein